MADDLKIYLCLGLLAAKLIVLAVFIETLIGAING